MKQISVLHLAVAEGRGHLVRAHRLRRLFAGTPIRIDIATTHSSGQAFLQELGTPSWVLPGGLSLPFDSRHVMQLGALRGHLAHYLRRGLLADIRALKERRADFYVNDSLHPALLSGLVDPKRVVLLHGDTMEEAFLGHFDEAPFRDAYRAIASNLLLRAGFRVHHSAFAVPSGTVDLNARLATIPPLLPPLLRSDADVRRALGAADGTPIATVYLNPHYREVAVAEAIERALAGRYHLHAVGEGYAGRPHWLRADPNLGEVIARSSVFVSGAGMASIAEARRADVPLLVLEGRQPEQTLNLERARPTFVPQTFARVPLGSLGPDELARAIRSALSSLRIPSAPRRSIAPVDSAQTWRNTFATLFGISAEALETTTPAKETFPHAA